MQSKGSVERSTGELAGLNVPFDVPIIEHCKFADVKRFIRNKLRHHREVACETCECVKSSHTSHFFSISGSSLNFSISLKRSDCAKPPLKPAEKRVKDVTGTGVAGRAML